MTGSTFLGKKTKSNIDLIKPVISGFILLLLCFFTLHDYTSPLAFLRVLIGIVYVFFLSGYPLATILHNRKDPSFTIERVFVSIGLSLLILYPAGLINVVLEGSENYFQQHLLGLISILFMITLVTASISFLLRKKSDTNFYLSRHFPKFNLHENRFLVILLILSVLLIFYDLNRADVYADEYYLSFISYDLVDGNLPGREAYVISFKDHSPFPLYINHAVMQLINPTNFYHLEDWMLRLGTAIICLFSIVLIYFLSKRIFDDTTAAIATLIFATSNYVVWTSRFFNREIFTLFFMLLAVYFFYGFVSKDKGKGYILLTGIFLGSALMCKFVAIFLIPVFVVYILLYNKKQFPSLLKILVLAFVLTIPLFAFNFGAYYKTGYMDMSFSKIFGADSIVGSTESYPGPAFSAINLYSIFVVLSEQFSFPLLLLFIICSLTSIRYIKSKPNGKNVSLLLLWLLFTFLFFWGTGVRSYYLLYIAAPFAIITAYIMETILVSRHRFFKIIAFGVFALVVIYSLVYTFNTNHNYEINFTTPLEPANAEISDAFDLNRGFSRFSRLYSGESRGWKEVSNFLYSKLEPGDLLLVDKDDSHITINHVEWYLTGKEWEITNYSGPTNTHPFIRKGITVSMLAGYDSDTIENYGRVLFLSSENILEEFGDIETTKIAYFGNPPILYIYEVPS